MSVCFKVLKNRIVDIPAPTAASVKDTSTPSSIRKIRAHIRLKMVVDIIAENKFLVTITYIDIMINTTNKKLINITSIFSLL
jgi:hypothetical protein